YLGQMQASFCNQGSAWACNELGILQAVHEADYAGAVESMQRGCALGFSPACVNLRNGIVIGNALKSAPPTLDDLPIVLRGTKRPISERSPLMLYALACREGWPDTCGRTN